MVADHIVVVALAGRWRWRWPERVPWPAAPIAFVLPGRTPLYGSRAWDSYARRAQPDQIFPDRNPFPAERRQIFAAGKPPLTAGSTGTCAECVILTANLGHCGCSTLACPA